ncbi:MAG TPA: hypothetical protein VN934_05890 [Candidatus Tumulicola sp.]|nr:hypothetical protein [Candidatus Tumulicola sp.]
MATNTSRRPVSDEQILYPYDGFLANRVRVIDGLLKADPYSIDALGLVGMVMCSLGRYCYPEKWTQRQFRLLLREHCPSFKERVSIPILLRKLKRDSSHARFESDCRQAYPLEQGWLVREATADPLEADFLRWAAGLGYKAPLELIDRATYSYLIYVDYRTCIHHELRVGKEHEPFRGLPTEREVYYENEGEEGALPEQYMFLCVAPDHLLLLLKEAIADLRAWALANRRNLFVNPASKIGVNGSTVSASN